MIIGDGLIQNCRSLFSGTDHKYDMEREPIGIELFISLYQFFLTDAKTRVDVINLLARANFRKAP